MPFPFRKRKVKITKTEFASVLDFCLSKGFEFEAGSIDKSITLEESINKIAEDIEFLFPNGKLTSSTVRIVE